MHIKLVISSIALAVVAAAQAPAPTPVAADAPFQVGYAGNLTKGDSVINITNGGAEGAPPNGPGFDLIGNTLVPGSICTNVYAFSPDEQLVSCCSCLVTPSGLVSLSVVNDLISNTLTGVRPNSIVVKLVTTRATAAGTSANCINSAATVGVGTNVVVSGILAWRTAIHDGPANSLALTETGFLAGSLSPGELTSITNRCLSILANGSTFGICRSCRSGGLGAERR